ncbi:hypothetical protein [Mannheimia haemolytica]|uniref:hypothetical protein n=1 Tax=Mannheimia haemolytica TaxID=75985 RepID=UPI0031F4ABE1
MAITEEQWKEIKQKLDSIIGRVKFRYKEHLLTVDVVQIKRVMIKALSKSCTVDPKISYDELVEWYNEVM